MGQVLIRNLPDDVIETYKEKARLAGTSLEQYLRDLMQRHAPFTPQERVAFADEIRAMSTPSRPLTKDEIRDGLG
jgi:antitoxin FitA